MTFTNEQGKLGLVENRNTPHIKANTPLEANRAALLMQGRAGGPGPGVDAARDGGGGREGEGSYTTAQSLPGKINGNRDAQPSAGSHSPTTQQQIPSRLKQLTDTVLGRAGKG